MQKMEILQRIDAARGLVPCDLVLKGAKWLDVFSGHWLNGDVAIQGRTIVGVGEKYSGRATMNLKGRYLVPGFIDSHVHVESTLMTPEGFERAVLPRGTTSAILDPHEIANVLGTKGLEYILQCAERACMDLYVMLSSCVPATGLETSGAVLNAQDLLPYKNHPKVLGLAEMMNYPGVLNKDPDVIEKIFQFQDGLIDGHSPLLRGKDLNSYLSCGIKTCHESVSRAEAQEKLERGMQVLLREGSVAKNLKELGGVLNDFSSPRVSLCTDDRNPLDILEEGHLDFMIRTAIKMGANPAAVYRSASLSTALCYGLKTKGALAPGYDADIVVLKDFKKCLVEKVIKSGRLVQARPIMAEKVRPTFSGDFPAPPSHNSMNFRPPTPDEIQVRGELGRASTKVRVIGIVKNNIITEDLRETLMCDDHGRIQADVKKDILKIAVAERHGRGLPVSVGFVKGMGLKDGAIGSSVGHDSHNAVAVGASDEDMALCFARLKELGGGFVVVEKGQVRAELALPIAGLMTSAPLKEIYKNLKALRAKAKKLGCRLNDPFLQMAFLCLPVIPSLKITDRGLVDVNAFSLVPVTPFDPKRPEPPRLET